MKTKDLDISFVNWLLERIKEPFLNGDIHTALLSSADGPKKQVAESRFRIPSRYPNADEYDVDIDEGGKVCRFDVPLANSDWMMDVPPVEYDDCKDKFFAFFEAVVEQTSRVFGKPVFNNGFGNPGFPVENAEWAAIWDCKGTQLLVLEGQEDRDTPFAVSIVLTKKRAPEPTAHNFT